MKQIIDAHELGELEDNIVAIKIPDYFIFVHNNKSLISTTQFTIQSTAIRKCDTDITV